MKEGTLLSLVLLACLVTEAITSTRQELEELETQLVFLEFDLEDDCTSRSEALWDIYSGKATQLTELLLAENRSADRFQKEIERHTKFKGIQTENKNLQRQLDLLFAPGSSLLSPPILTEFISYATKAEIGNSIVKNSTTPSVNQVNKLLRSETDRTKLKDIWINHVQNIEENVGDLTQQLSLLDLEAEANGAESAEKYWLSQSEITWTDYEGLTKLWNEIVPLYQKLRSYIARHIITKYGREVLTDPKLIPVHVLGSLDSSDWVTAAETAGAFKDSKSFNILSSTLSNKTNQDLYFFADQVTSHLRLGSLPKSFFASSEFEGTNQNCVHFVEDHCKIDTIPRVLACKEDPPTVSALLRAHEEIARIKHLNLTAQENLGNGYFFRKGTRDSVLYEAISTATSLLALHPENSQRSHLMPNAPPDSNITSLLITALHIIPVLPLHLTYDYWRLEALKAINPDDEVTTTPENIPPTTLAYEKSHTESVDNESDQNDSDDYDYENKIDNSEVDEKPAQTTSKPADEKDEEETTVSSDLPNQSEPYGKANLTADWWSIRAKLQGVSSPDSNQYADYLSDKDVAWNKAHVSKFLGPILLFQVLDHFKAGNTTENIDLLHLMLTRGKSQPWELVVTELFNITEISAEPLLRYFKPLEEFLDGGGKFSEKSNSSLFSQNNFNLFTQTSSATEEKSIVSASEDSNAILIILVGLAAIGISAVVFSIIKKRYTKKRRDRRRRRNLEYM